MTNTMQHTRSNLRAIDPLVDGAICNLIAMDEPGWIDLFDNRDDTGLVFFWPGTRKSRFIVEFDGKLFRGFDDTGKEQYLNAFDVGNSYYCPDFRLAAYRKGTSIITQVMTEAINTGNVEALSLIMTHTLPGCPLCNSTELMMDATAVFCPEVRDWVLSDVHDPKICTECGHEFDDEHVVESCAWRLSDEGAADNSRVPSQRLFTMLRLFS